MRDFFNRYALWAVLAVALLCLGGIVLKLAGLLAIPWGVIAFLTLLLSIIVAVATAIGLSLRK